MLTPFIEQEVQESELTIQPSKTYAIDFVNGRLLTTKIDGLNAIKQMCYKSLFTERFRYNIYDDDFGSELESLIGQSHTNEYLESAIPDMVTECLKIDDRVGDVSDIEIIRNGSKVEINFRLTTSTGDELMEGVTLNV